MAKKGKGNTILQDYIGSMINQQHQTFEEMLHRAPGGTITIRAEDMPPQNHRLINNNAINNNLHWNDAQGYAAAANGYVQNNTIADGRKTTTQFAKEIEDRLSKIEKALYAKKIMFKDAANEGIDFYGSNEWKKIFDSLDVTISDSAIATLSQFYEPPVKKSL